MLDSGSSISLVNKEMVKGNQIFQGKEVFDVKNKSFSQNQWATVFFELGPSKLEINRLVMEDVSFKFLISRPLMKEMRMNLHFDDTISFGTFELTSVVRDQESTLRTIDDLKRTFPNAVCDSEYPPPVKFFEVPFRLESDTPIRRKPYKLSRAKPDHVREELENMKKNGVIRESSTPFASPILMVPKAKCEMETLHRLPIHQRSNRAN